ncbi:MAG: DUF3098 domain-containing protein [Bacteroidales bacterium]|nr:DUF3098 domain-containing protein [Bacteroidales bacterium]MDE6801925.1 DUF3098 domain-containing protein [Muribaculaceae bacterium]MDE6832122.1 DUF3098 domain-containing protein [Muribaculaceae bacterium]
MSINVNKSSNSNGAESRLEKATHLPLVKINFILMACSAALIVLGFLLMLGGSSTTSEFNADIFSSRRIIIGPTIAFLGFVAMGISIIYKPKNRD